MIVYKSDDDGTLYPESLIIAEHKHEVDPNSKEVDGFIAYEIDEKIELTAEQCCHHYGDIVEILLAANKIKRIGK